MKKIIKINDKLTIVYEKSKQDIPITSGALVYHYGYAFENKEKAGITSLTFDALLTGTKNKTKDEINEILEKYNVAIASNVYTTVSSVSFKLIDETGDTIFPLLIDILKNPGFPENEFLKLRKKTESEIKSIEDNTFADAFKIFEKKYYKDYPFSRHPAGEIETVEKLSIKDIARHYWKNIVSSEKILYIETSIPFEKIRKNFTDLSDYIYEKKKKEYKLKDFKYKENEIFEKKKDIKQYTYIIGFPIKDDLNDYKMYSKYYMLKSLLSGGMSSLLFKIRETEGIGYQIGAFFTNREKANIFIFYLGTHLSDENLVLKKFKEALKSIADKKITQQFFIDTKNLLKGTYLISNQSISRRVSDKALYLMKNNDENFMEKAVNYSKNITMEQAAELAEKIYNSDYLIVKISPEK